MSDTGGVLMGRAEIEHAFTLLGERLARRGVVADLFVVGGAAMALAYDATRVTRDVDAMFAPHGIVVDESLAAGAGRSARVIRVALCRPLSTMSPVDLLFPGGVGNTRGDAEAFGSLIDPGHGKDSTLGRERPAVPEWRARGW